MRYGRNKGSDYYLQLTEMQSDLELGLYFVEHRYSWLVNSLTMVIIYLYMYAKKKMMQKIVVSPLFSPFPSSLSVRANQAQSSPDMQEYNVWSAQVYLSRFCNFAAYIDE
jgi:hypothetical protein